jgi:hypothetical protein
MSEPMEMCNYNLTIQCLSYLQRGGKVCIFIHPLFPHSAHEFYVTNHYTLQAFLNSSCHAILG